MKKSILYGLVAIVPMCAATQAGAIERTARAESPMSDARWTPGIVDGVNTDLTTGAVGSMPNPPTVVTEPKTSRFPTQGVTLPRAMSRSTIMDVQNALDEKGFGVKVDGVIGSQTTGALRQFQRERGLAQSGIIDAPTLSALDVTTNDFQRSPASVDTTSPSTSMGDHREPTAVPKKGETY